MFVIITNPNLAFCYDRGRITAWGRGGRPAASSAGKKNERFQGYDRHFGFHLYRNVFRVLSQFSRVRFM